MDIRSGPAAVQPPLMSVQPAELSVAIAGLALGGAERIVIDWATRIRPPWSVHLIVLRNQRHEWPLPPSLRVTRLDGADVLSRLSEIGRAIARTPVPVCVCHLLTESERRAIASSGAFVVPVIHNAEPGWMEPATALSDARHVATVSDASAAEIRRGCRATVSVIRHLPQPRPFSRDARAKLRAAWRIPADAAVIGMTGAVKPQKDYPFAVRLLRAVLARRDAYLVIVGGPVGKRGRSAWQAILDEVHRSQVRHRVALPGFVYDAAGCLPAFDLLLNTSAYEGLSLATLEARISGVPVVASRVGGQGELGDEALTLVDKDAPIDAWTDAIVAAFGSKPAPPVWRHVPAHRLWTLVNIARPVDPDRRVLFITANLNAGGAQRSLVNLLSTGRRSDAEVVVTGDSTATYFFETLRSLDVPVCRSASTRDPFDHAERLVRKVCDDRAGVVCFWNVDPKIKLLVTKALAFTSVRIVDVSPGPSSFDEMASAAEFARLIAFPESAYYHRLDRLVVKYRATVPQACEAKTVVIPNGVAASSRVKGCYETPAGGGRVVVNGRIAPTKFVVEIVEAMSFVRTRIPSAELHIFGTVEPRHAPYAERVRSAVGDARGRSVFFHHSGPDTRDRLADFDVFVVLGQDQGCPNALLEALAAGLPSIANDDGGTAEQLLHEQTGLVVPDRSPTDLASAIERLLVDRRLAADLAAAGKRHVLSSFGLDLMASRYEQLFTSLSSDSSEENTA